MLGEVAGCRGSREERGFLLEGSAGPAVLFWECSKGFDGWKRKRRLLLHHGLESHSIFGLTVGCPYFVVFEVLALHVANVGFSVRSKLQVVDLPQGSKIQSFSFL